MDWLEYAQTQYPEMTRWWYEGYRDYCQGKPYRDPLLTTSEWRQGWQQAELDLSLGRMPVAPVPQPSKANVEVRPSGLEPLDDNF